MTWGREIKESRRNLSLLEFRLSPKPGHLVARPTRPKENSFAHSQDMASRPFAYPPCHPSAQRRDARDAQKRDSPDRVERCGVPLPEQERGCSAPKSVQELWDATGEGQSCHQEGGFSSPP